MCTFFRMVFRHKYTYNGHAYAITDDNDIDGNLDNVSSRYKRKIQKRKREKTHLMKRRKDNDFVWQTSNYLASVASTLHLEIESTHHMRCNAIQ